MISILFAACVFACSPSLDLIAWAEGSTLWVEAGADTTQDFEGSTEEEIKYLLKHPKYMPKDRHEIFVVNVAKSNGKAMQKLLRVERYGWNAVVFPIVPDGPSEFVHVTFGGWNMMENGYYRFNGQWDNETGQFDVSKGQWQDRGNNESIQTTRDKAIEANDKREDARMKSIRPVDEPTNSNLFGTILAIMGVVSFAFYCGMRWMRDKRRKRK